MAESTEDERPFWTSGRLWRIGGLSAVSLVLLVVTFRRTDLAQLLRHIGSIFTSGRWGYLLLATAVDVFVIMARVWKWRFLLAPIRRIAVGHVFSAVVIGILSNNVLFFRMDEIVRAYVLGRRERLSKSLVLGTIAVERCWDAAVVLAVFTALAFTIAVPRDLLWARTLMAALLVASVGILALAVVFEDAFAHFATGLVEKVSRSAAQRVGTIFSSFLAGLRVFPRKRRLLGLVLFSSLEWFGEYCFVMLVAAAVDIDLMPEHVLLYIAASFVGFSLPSSPSAVGTYHWIANLALFPVHAANAARKSFVVVCHAMMVVPVSLIGLVFTWKEGISLSQLERAADVLSPMHGGNDA